MQKYFWYAFVFLLPTQFGRYFFFDFSYISGIRIDYLAPAAFMTDIFLILLAFNCRGAILKFIQEHKDFFILGGAFIIAQAILAHEPLLSLFGTVWIIRVLITYIVTRDFLDFNNPLFRERLHNTVVFLLLALMFQFLLVMLQISKQASIQGIFYLFGERFLTASTPGVAKTAILDTVFLRPYGTFSHPNSLGGFFVGITAIFLPLGRFFKSYAFPQLLLYRKIILFVSALLVLMSFSKTAIFALGVLYLVHHFYGGFAETKKPWEDCTLCFFGKIFLFACIGLIFISSSWDSETLILRSQLLSQASTILLHNPLFGTGFLNHLYAHATFPQTTGYFFLQPVHNIIMLFLMQVGIVGGIIFGVPLVIYLRKTVRSYPHTITLFRKRRNYAALLLILGILITGMFDHYWITLQQNILLLGLAFGIRDVTV